MSTLHSPVVVVTGAASGIGAATVAELLQRGARVLAADVDDRVHVDEQQGRINRVVDVRSSEAVDAMIAVALQSFGRLDAIFNNAGTLGVSEAVEEYPDDVFKQVLDVNVAGVFHGMRSAIPALRKTEGVILNNASTGGMVGAARQAPYVASKHAVVGLTRSAALELAPVGIAVNALCPGPTDTPIMHEVVEGWRRTGADAAAALAAVTPTARMARAEEIAAVAAWLLLDAPPYLTGAVVPVDGAQTAR